MNRFSGKVAAGIVGAALVVPAAGAGVASCNPDPDPSGTTTTTASTTTTTMARSTTTSEPSPSTTIVPGAKKVIPCPPNPDVTKTNSIALVSGGQLDADALTNEARPLFTISGDGGNANYRVNIDGFDLGIWGTCSITSGAVGVQAEALSNGPHAIAGTEVTPRAGMVGPFTFTIDTVPPPVPFGLHLVTVINSRAAVNGNADPGVTVRLYVDGHRNGGGITGANGIWMATTLTLAAGSHTATARTVDPAGNESADSDPLTFTVP